MEKKKRRVSLSVRESMESTGLLLISILCGKNVLNFLLDSGSDNNCIDIASFSDKMHLLESSNNALNLFGMEGNTYKCDRRILHLGDKMNYAIEVTVLPDTNGLKAFSAQTGYTVHGILGLDFMRRTKCVLDMGNMKVMFDPSALVA